MNVRRLSVAGVILLATVVGSQERPGAGSEEARKDLQALQGTWQLESIDSGKKEKVDVKKRSLFFGTSDKGDVFLVREGNKMLQAGTFRLVTSKSPRRIDMVVAKGTHQDNTMLGIYELKDNTLKVCIDPDGEGRPDKFVTKTDAPRYLATYKRVKPPGEDIDILGKYTSTSIDGDGKKQTLTVQIERRGDGYFLRWMVPAGLAYIGTGIRQGNTLSVTYINRGSLGLVVYKIEKGPKLLGTYTDVGGVGLLAKEELQAETVETYEVRNR